MSSDWDIPIFPISLAAKAAGISAIALRQWFARGRVVLLEDDAPAEASGLPHKLTFRSVLQISLTAKLASSGIDVAEANAASWHWVHAGLCGEVYDAPESLTAFVHFGGGRSQIVCAKFVNGEVSFAISDLIDAQGTGVPPIVVFLDTLLSEVRRHCDEYLLDRSGAEG